MKNQGYQARILLINFNRLEKVLLFNLFSNNFKIVGIVSDYEIEEISYFLQYDSFHGKFFPNKIAFQKTKGEQKLIFEDNKKNSIHVFPEKEITPKKLKVLNIDFVIDCSRKDIQPSQLSVYIKHAKHIIVNAANASLNKLEHKLLVFPFNHNKINEKDKIILIPRIESVVTAILLKALHEKLKIKSCHFESLRGPSNDMLFLDSLSSTKDLAGSRSIFSNIIPNDFSSENNSLKSLLKEEEINVETLGSSVVCPINSGSLLKLYLQIKKIHKVSEINDLLNQDSDAQIGFSLKPLVAKDIESTYYYGVIDKNLTQILSTKNNQTLTLGIWFDYETSMAVCFFKTIQFLAGKLSKQK